MLVGGNLSSTPSAWLVQAQTGVPFSISSVVNPSSPSSFTASAADGSTSVFQYASGACKNAMPGAAVSQMQQSSSSSIVLMLVMLLSIALMQI
jgi:hypothetical protein